MSGKVSDSVTVFDPKKKV